MAKAIADSAAAIVITNKAKTWHFSSWESIKVENDAKLRFTAFKSNYNDIRTRTTFWLDKKP